MRLWFLLAVAIVVASSASAKPISTRAVKVIDGDTLYVRGKIVRLVGFDAPEKGELAHCAAERALAARATARLRQIVSGGGLDLTYVSCGCPRGTEGTRACNYGRACGVLTAARRNAGSILVREGLAHRYVCERGRCPARESWCTPWWRKVLNKVRRS